MSIRKDYAFMQARHQTSARSRISNRRSLGTLSTILATMMIAAMPMPLRADATVAKATISDFATSIQLPSANMYLYGMVTGGASQSSAFATGQYAQAVDAAGYIAAALAYGTNNQNSYTTSTAYQVIGGVSISGSWDSFKTFYNSNSTAGASSASVNFTVSENSLVVFLGLASSQQSISLGGIPSLQVDALESGPSANLGMVIAHASLTPGTYTVTEQSAALAAGQDPQHMADLIGVFVFGSQSTSVPVINPGGVLNAASSVPGAVAPGSVASVYGSFLLTSPSQAPGVPLPTSLGGLSMQFGGKVQVPLYYAARGQANIQVPWELAGQSQAALTATVNGQSSAAQTVSLAPFAPGMFSMNRQGTGQGAILDSAYNLVGSSNPATAGVTNIQIYCTGLGAVSNQPSTGAAAPSSPLSKTTTTPTVTIGGILASVSFSGLSPGSVGLYQVNVQVPLAAPTGNAVPVVLSIGGATSNTVTIAVIGGTGTAVTQQSVTSAADGSASFPSAGLSVMVTDIASQQPLAGMRVTLLQQQGSQPAIAVADPSGKYVPLVTTLSSISQVPQASNSDSIAGGSRTLAASGSGSSYVASLASSLNSAGQWIWNLPLSISQAVQNATASSGGCPTITGLYGSAGLIGTVNSDLTAASNQGQLIGALIEDPFEALSTGVAGLFGFAPGTIVGGLFMAYDTQGLYSTLTQLQQAQTMIDNELQGEYGDLSFNTTYSVCTTDSLFGESIRSLIVSVASTPATPTGSGAILGSIQNSLGAPLTGVVATASGPIQSVAVTDVNGSFSMSNLPAGVYSIQASKRGYQPGTEVVDVQGGQQTSAVINLAVFVGTNQPMIQSVTPIFAQPIQGIVITGSGFGTTPPQTVTLNDGSVDTVACNTSTPALAIRDSAPGVNAWEAGQKSCSSSDSIGINLASWSDTQIALNGFGSGLAASAGSHVIAPGDPLTVVVTGPSNSGTATYNMQVSPAAPVTSTGAVTVNVPANQATTDTGVRVNVGDTVMISAAGLVILTTDGHLPPMSPAGFPPNCLAAGNVQPLLPFPAPQLPCWSLIGQIGTSGALFEVGTNTIFQASTAGELYFGINDNYLGDNSGSWTASVTVSSGSK